MADAYINKNISVVIVKCIQINQGKYLKICNELNKKRLFEDADEFKKIFQL